MTQATQDEGERDRLAKLILEKDERRELLSGPSMTELGLADAILSAGYARRTEATGEARDCRGEGDTRG